MAPPGLQSPDAQPEMADVVQPEEGGDGHQGRGAKPEHHERREGAERKERGPDQAVTERTKRATERCPEPLDALRCLALELRTRQCADRHAGEVGVCVEVLAL